MDAETWYEGKVVRVFSPSRSLIEVMTPIGIRYFTFYGMSRLEDTSVSVKLHPELTHIVSLMEG